MRFTLRTMAFSSIVTGETSATHMTGETDMARATVSLDIVGVRLDTVATYAASACSTRVERAPTHGFRGSLATRSRSSTADSQTFASTSCRRAARRRLRTRTRIRLLHGSMRRSLGLPIGLVLEGGVHSSRPSSAPCERRSSSSLLVDIFLFDGDGEPNGLTAIVLSGHRP